MRKFSRWFIFGYLLFFVSGVFAYTDVKAGDFSSGQLEAHFLKHGAQFGGITQEQYLEGARALLDADAEGDVLEKIRRNGDVEHFRVSTGEFAVMTRRGRIRTYFKTDYEYWLRQ
jgi:pyocin large subunit-like protein